MGFELACDSGTFSVEKLCERGCNDSRCMAVAITNDAHKTTTKSSVNFKE